ncbi:MAG: HAMP domain-containing histidine kinase [Erysipelothrix sp.]|nr:HAMP domain-containing histidine kinase [Erysipelothrix sp.]
MKQIFKGIRLRVFVIMAFFALGLLALLYSLQISLLPTYYQNQVFQRVEGLSNKVVTLINADNQEDIDFGNMYNSLLGDVKSNNICLYIFNSANVIEVEINTMGSQCYLDYLISPMRTASNEPLPIISQYTNLARDSESSNYYFTVQPNDLMVSQIFYGQEMTVSDIPYYLFINTPYELLDSTVDTLKDQFMFVSMIVFALSSIIAFLISMILSQPLTQMSKEANKLALGNMDVHFPHGGYTEIDTLADTLNYATEEIKKTDNLRTDLLANISHDIRTPLTMISAYTEMIQDISKDDPEKMQEHLSVIMREVENMNALLADMMTLSQVQSNTTRLNITEFDVVTLTKSVIQSFQPSIEQNRIQLNLESVDKAMVSSDEIKSRQIITNYLTNAMKHVGDDRLITIRIFTIYEIGYVRVEVIDQGSGISKEDLKHIWDRYFKTNRNNQRSKEGTGLGLAITKAICERIGLPYGVISEPYHGSTFYVEFPLVQKTIFDKEIDYN